MSFSLLETILIVLIIALVVTVIFRYLRLPVILGYLFVGTLVGPHVLGWLPATTDVKELAEFGVVLLMFTIGLEFSLSKLFALKQAVFILGGLQVFISIIITTILGRLLGMSLNESIVIGGVVAMSSTAIVIKQLSEQQEINSKHGLKAVGILLFQDLAVIPLLVFIASIAGINGHSFFITLIWSILKGIMAVVVIFIVGRWLLRPLFHVIAATRVVELFTLSVLLIVIGAAWLTEILGLSYALGAFLAGIMLGETEFKHQINIEIRPFRDVLLGLFFITIGMLVNITIWLDTWVWILLLVIALMIGKALLITVLCLLSKENYASATRTGLVLAQGGEFGFAILSLALTNRLLPADYGQVVLAALLISFALAPIIIRYNEKIVKFLLPKQKKISDEMAIDLATTRALTKHVIICGYGRVGQNIARFLDKVKQPFIGIDLDPKLIHNAKLAGDIVAYGNASHPDILKAVQLEKAKAIVLSIDDSQSAITILNQIQKIRPKIPTLVRCKDESAFETLKQHGATIIVAEVFEESLTLVNYLFQQLRIPHEKIAKLFQDVRDKDYQLLRQVFLGSFPEESEDGVVLHEHLRPIQIIEEAYAIGHSLSELPLQQVKVVAIHRGKKHLKPRKNLKLYSGDILIIYGSPMHLEEAERILLMG